MIVYALIDGDDNITVLNGPTVTSPLRGSLGPGNDSFGFVNRKIDKSYLDGATLVGEPRTGSREMSLQLTISSKDSDLFRADANGLTKAVYSARKLLDVTNDLVMDIVAEDIVFDYGGVGNFKLMANVEIRFTALTPYWRDRVATTLTGTVAANTLTEIPTDNQGFMQSPPVITLETTGPVPTLQVYVESNEIGMTIIDDVFGTVGYLTMLIDCLNGEITLGDLNRNVNIQDGTGFFQIPTGADKIVILTSLNAVDYTINFYKRYYL